MPAVEPTRQMLVRYAEARGRFPEHASYPAAIVDVSSQRLHVFAGETCVDSYPVSTSRFGTGEKQDSYKTPCGVHCVAEKIGADAAFAEIFRARKRTHQIARIEPGKNRSDKECITSRILWLAGLEEGCNKGAGVDSHARYIYIHGTDEEGLVGQPASEGCVRMKNRDIMDLFERLDVSSLVIICE